MHEPEADEDLGTHTGSASLLPPAARKACTGIFRDVSVHLLLLSLATQKLSAARNSMESASQPPWGQELI